MRIPAPNSRQKRKRHNANRQRDRRPPIERLEEPDRPLHRHLDWPGHDQPVARRRQLAGRPRPRNPGDDLVFPQLTGTGPFVAVDDFAAGTTFNSIAIEGSNYELDGQQIDLNDRLRRPATPGTSSDILDTALGGGTIEGQRRRGA